MDLPQRKQNRLQGFDYSSPGVYFVTVCTKGMAEMFWRNTEPTALIDVPFVGEITDLPQPSSIFEPSVQLSDYGQLVDHAIQNIPLVYPMITVNKYVIMPNHVHLLLQIHTDAEHVGGPYRKNAGHHDNRETFEGVCYKSNRILGLAAFFPRPHRPHRTGLS